MTTEASIPTWSAYNSLISDAMPLAHTGTPQLIPAPAQEWSTLLTVLKQTQWINTVLVGINRNTVLNFDMDLYKPGKQLEKYCEDLQVQFIFQLGELHAVMAMLRTNGQTVLTLTTVVLTQSGLN